MAQIPDEIAVPFRQVLDEFDVKKVRETAKGNEAYVRAILKNAIQALLTMPKQQGLPLLPALVPPSDDWEAKINWMQEDWKRSNPPAKYAKFNWHMDRDIPDLFDECVESYQITKSQMADHVVDHYKSQGKVENLGGLCRDYLYKLALRRRKGA